MKLRIRLACSSPSAVGCGQHTWVLFPLQCECASGFYSRCSPLFSEAVLPSTMASSPLETSLFHSLSFNALLRLSLQLCASSLLLSRSQFPSPSLNLPTTSSSSYKSLMMHMHTARFHRLPNDRCFTKSATLKTCKEISRHQNFIST